MSVVIGTINPYQLEVLQVLNPTINFLTMSDTSLLSQFFDTDNLDPNEIVVMALLPEQNFLETISKLGLDIG
jgi:hypothetical protein